MAKLTGGQIKKRFLKEAFPYGSPPFHCTRICGLAKLTLPSLRCDAIIP